MPPNRTPRRVNVENLERTIRRNILNRAVRNIGLRAHNNYNSNATSRNNAAVKIQAALRGWLARAKYLPKNKFTLVIGPNGVPMVAVKPTRLGVSVAKKAANMKQYNSYIARLRGM